MSNSPIRVLIVDDQALVRGSFRLLIDSAADLVAVGEAGNGLEAVRLAGREHPDVVLMDVRMPEMDGIDATRLICHSADNVPEAANRLEADNGSASGNGSDAGAAPGAGNGTHPDTGSNYENDLDASVDNTPGARSGADSDLTLSAPDDSDADTGSDSGDGSNTTVGSGRPPQSTRVLILTTFDLDSYVYSALRAGASGFLLKDTPPTQLLDAIRTVAAGEALLAPTVTRRLISEFTRQPARPALAPDLVGITEREREVLSLIAQGLSNQEIAGHLYLSITTVKTHISRLLSKLNARDRAQLVIVAYEAGLVTARKG